MICSRCNNECKDGEKFCHICGNKLIHSSEAAPAAPAQPSGSDDTTLLEDVNYEGADETTLLDEPDLNTYGSPEKQTVQPKPVSPEVPSSSYRYNPKQENSGKERVIVAAVIAVVAVIIIAVLWLN